VEWSVALDKLSVHVGINFRCRLARLQGEKPVRILLGREHTRLFMQEKGWDYIPKGPHVYGAKGQEIPIVFNCRHIHGIAIETNSTPAHKARKHGGSEDEKVQPPPPRP